VYYALASGKLHGHTVESTVMVVKDSAFEEWLPKNKSKKTLKNY
jgi:hypothetical protein